MPRAPFDKLCTIYRGSDETKIIAPFAAHVPCRLIAQDGIIEAGADALPVNWYLTIEDVAPLGSWAPAAQIQLAEGDWIKIETPGYPFFTVVYVKHVDWESEPDYFQGHLVPFRHVRRIASGGILLSGEAETSDEFSGSGGIVVGGSASLLAHHEYQKIASGGVLIGGDGCPYVLSHTKVVVIVLVDASGGILIGGEADVVFTPAGHYLFDDFNHDGGSSLDGTSLESGAGLPATWFISNQDFAGTGDSAVTLGYAPTTTIPGGLLVDTGNADGTAQCASYGVLLISDFAAGMIVRFADIDNFLDFQFDTITGDYALYSVVGGTVTLQASSAGSWSTDAANPTIVKCVMSGTAVDFYVNGSLIFGYTDNDLTSNTSHGVYGFRLSSVLDGKAVYKYWWFDL